MNVQNEVFPISLILKSTKYYAWLLQDSDFDFLLKNCILALEKKSVIIKGIKAEQDLSVEYLLNRVDILEKKLKTFYFDLGGSHFKKEEIEIFRVLCKDLGRQQDIFVEFYDSSDLDKAGRHLFQQHSFVDLKKNLQRFLKSGQIQLEYFYILCSSEQNFQDFRKSLYIKAGYDGDLIEQLCAAGGVDQSSLTNQTLENSRLQKSGTNLLNNSVSGSVGQKIDLIEDQIWYIVDVMIEGGLERYLGGDEGLGYRFSENKNGVILNVTSNEESKLVKVQEQIVKRFRGCRLVSLAGADFLGDGLIRLMARQDRVITTRDLKIAYDYFVREKIFRVCSFYEQEYSKRYQYYVYVDPGQNAAIKEKQFWEEYKRVMQEYEVLEEKKFQIVAYLNPCYFEKYFVEKMPKATWAVLQKSEKQEQKLTVYVQKKLEKAKKMELQKKIHLLIQEFFYQNVLTLLTPQEQAHLVNGEVQVMEGEEFSQKKIYFDFRERAKIADREKQKQILQQKFSFQREEDNFLKKNFSFENEMENENNKSQKSQKSFEIYSPNKSKGKISFQEEKDEVMNGKGAVFHYISFLSLRNFEELNRFETGPGPFSKTEQSEQTNYLEMKVEERLARNEFQKKFVQFEVQVSIPKKIKYYFRKEFEEIFLENYLLIVEKQVKRNLGQEIGAGAFLDLIEFLPQINQLVFYCRFQLEDQEESEEKTSEHQENFYSIIEQIVSKEIDAFRIEVSEQFDDEYLNQMEELLGIRIEIDQHNSSFYYIIVGPLDSLKFFCYQFIHNQKEKTKKIVNLQKIEFKIHKIIDIQEINENLFEIEKYDKTLDGGKSLKLGDYIILADNLTPFLVQKFLKNKLVQKQNENFEKHKLDMEFCLKRITKRQDSIDISQPFQEAEFSIDLNKRIFTVIGFVPNYLNTEFNIFRFDFDSMLQEIKLQQFPYNTEAFIRTEFDLSNQLKPFLTQIAAKQFALIKQIAYKENSKTFYRFIVESFEAETTKKIKSEIQEKYFQIVNQLNLNKIK